MHSSYLHIGDIPAKLYHAENAHGTVVAIHGFGGSMESHAIALLAEKVCTTGLNVLTFDLPAHGSRKDDTQQLDPINCVSEIIAVERYITENFSGELYAFATSYGAFCLLHRLEQQPDSYRRIVLRVPAVNMAQSLAAICSMQNTAFLPEKAREQGFHVEIGRKYDIPYSFYERLQELSCLRSSESWNSDRILAISAACDELVAPADTAEFLRCNPKIRPLCIKGATHQMPVRRDIEAAVNAASDFFFRGKAVMKICAMPTLCVDVYEHNGEIRPGGEALNFAAIASRYSHIDISIIGAVGDDNYGREIIRSIEGRKINTDNLHILPNVPTASHTISLTEDGDRYFKEGAWNGGALDVFSLNNSDKEKIRRCDAAFVTYYTPAFHELIELRRNNNFMLAVDFDICRDFAQTELYLPYIDYFFISGNEEILPIFCEWAKRYDTIFNITLAEKGSVTYHHESRYRVSAVPVEKVVDTTGCGDSYHAGFLCHHLRHADIRRAMTEGSRTASETLSHVGGF